MADQISINPNPVEPIFVAIRRALRNVHTSMPANVVTYNPATRIASVALATMLETGPGPSHEPMPPLLHVPVIWPGGAAGIVHTLLTPADSVLVIFTEQDPAGWLRTKVPLLPPELTGRHGLYAFALPGGHTDVDLLPTNGVWMTPAGVDLGAQAGTQPVALATALATAISASCDAAVAASVPNDGGTAAFSAFKAAMAGAAAGVAATLVRAV